MRPLISSLVAVLALGLSGCGDDEEPSADPTASATADASPADPSYASPTTPAPNTSSGTGVPPACDLADEADVEATFGVAVTAGSEGGGGHNEDNLVWQTDNCDWESAGALEVTLAVSEAEDFEGGELLCPVLSHFDAEPTPVPELGDGASWLGYVGNETEGTLRVCGDEVLLDIDVVAPAGSIDLAVLRQQSAAFARLALWNLRS